MEKDEPSSRSILSVRKERYNRKVLGPCVKSLTFVLFEAPSSPNKRLKDCSKFQHVLSDEENLVWE